MNDDRRSVRRALSNPSAARRGIRRVPWFVTAAGLGLLACGPTPPPTPQPLGNLRVTSNGSLAFSQTTGLEESFFSTDHALGTTPLIPLDTTRLLVHYDDNFSTFSTNPAVGSSQEEVLVLARDPDEYLATLESIVGPSSDPQNPGHSLDWARETFAPCDAWPVVPTSDLATHPPAGITLPLSVSLPYPDDGVSPQTDWSMSKAEFAGSSSLCACGPLTACPTSGFAGQAASFGGSIKGISVMQRGVCSTEQDLGAALGDITSSVPTSINVVPAEIDVADLGAATFVSYQGKGGFVLTTHIDVLQRVFLPGPAFFTDSLDANSTYWFGLDDGIVTISPNTNVYNWSGPDYYGIDGTISGLLNTVAPNRVKLAALEGKKGTFTGGQAQPIPVALPAPGVDCTTTTGQRPASCFTPCGCPPGGCTDGVDMSDPSTWPAAEDAGNDADVDPASWHNKEFCTFAATTLSGIVASAASSYPNGMTTNGPADLANTIVEDLDGDSTKFHNLRCNFHPRYESGPNVSTDPLTSGNPFNFGAKQISTGAPVCEIIVRAKRLNVLPDKIEAVFFDGPDLLHVDPSQFGNFPSPTPAQTGVGSEAFATFLAIQALRPSATTQLCSRGAETSMAAPVTRPFAHVLIR